MKKKQTKRTHAATTEKSKDTAAEPARAEVAANRATPPPAALAEIEAARANVENDPAVERFFECIFEECGKPSEPTAGEMKVARANVSVALKEGNSALFVIDAKHDADKAEKAAARAEIARTLTGWIRGDAPPPDGATRADAALRGIAWEGWEWNLRGVDVSRPNAETIDEADRHAECLRRVEKEAAEVLAWKVANGGPARDNPVTPAREAAERYSEALCDEDEAWAELGWAEKDARTTLPAAELAAAKARLDGRAPADAGAKDAVNPGGKKNKKSREEVARNAVKWKMRKAVEDWLPIHEERRRRNRITRETPDEVWAQFFKWVSSSGSGYTDVAREFDEDIFRRLRDSVRHR